MYARVKAHPGVRTIYAQRLIKEGVIDEAELNEMIEERSRRYEDALARAKGSGGRRNRLRNWPSPVMETRWFGDCRNRS